jgi:hypothetical protein
MEFWAWLEASRPAGVTAHPQKAVPVLVNKVVDLRSLNTAGPSAL